MKKALSAFLSLLLLAFVFPSPPASAADGVSFTLTVDALEADAASGRVTAYLSDADAPRVIPAERFNFRNASLLIFDADGRLVEAGGNLVPDTDGTNGSPQRSVTIPAGGFLLAFGAGADERLKQCYDTAFEGAMLYNATMSVIYDVRGTLDAETRQLSIAYPAPEPETDETLKFLFVGNSTTYFNGTPLKFKALCRAAGIDVSVTYCTFGSAYLSEFADETHERGRALRRALNDKAFDYVVLQDAGGASLEASEAALNVLLPLIEENGAEPLLYMRYSDKRDDDARVADTKRHYETYTALSEKYGIPASPVALAFRDAILDGWGQTLYADDRSHHSKEGSYLIACTWLDAFLDVSPVGNTYTAGLDAETVRYLQETARSSRTASGDAPATEPAIYTDGDGAVYPNLALGRPYTATGAPYDGNWTDTKADGTPIGKLTDGYACTDGSDTSAGCYKGAETAVTIDLGGVFAVKRITTDLFGNESWGIPSPDAASVTFLVSEDGESFVPFGAGAAEEQSEADGWQRAVFACTAETPVRASHVRVVYGIGGSFCWVSEINAFGVEAGSAPEESADVSESDPASESSDEAPEVSEAENISVPATGSSAAPFIAGGCAIVIAAGLMGFFLYKKRARRA